jgi:hypothetical protein
MITKKKEDREAPRKTKIYLSGCCPNVTQRHSDAKSGSFQIIGFLSNQPIDTDSCYTSPHWPQLNWSVGAFLFLGIGFASVYPRGERSRSLALETSVRT